jgi:ribosomal protein S18 acetylase RimI-like enzyme
VQVRPFESTDRPAAARLLADRHRRHRTYEPLLSAAYEDISAAEAEIRALLDAGATGAVAERGGEPVGYLLGVEKPDPVWGSNAWVEAAGHAVQDAEVVRDLWAAAAESWIAAGRDAHYALVPAYDRELVDAWFRLGFGQQHVHGIRELPDKPAGPPPPGVVLRPAQESDIEALVELDLELPRHQGASPVFSAGHVPSPEESAEEAREALADKRLHLIVAEHAGAVVGLAVTGALELSSSHRGPSRPDRAGFLAFAAVAPEARGLGVGRALGEEVLDWIAHHDFDCAVTDWRATNLLSSRTWPRLGFRPSFLRLHRRIGY